MREDKKTRFLCDSCGQLGHWKYQPMCPNYNKHLEVIQQTAAAYNAGQGGLMVAGHKEEQQWSPIQGYSNQDKLAMV
jgi:hypothetical protein